MKAPAVDIEAAKTFMLTHAKACYPYEACGLIVRKGESKKQEVICGRNMAADPRHEFCLHPEDYGIAEDMGEILAVYHSHCDESPEPSIADKRLSETQSLPVIIVGLTRQKEGFADHWEIYKPTGWKADLSGRPFVWGVLDCFTLVQDYYAEKHGIKLPDIAYTPDFAHHRRDGSGKVIQPAQDLYGEHLPKAGFVRVYKTQPGDLILMQCKADVPNHCAVYTGDGMMLHHAPGQISGEHPYISEQGYYAKCTVGIYRHKELIK